MADELDDFARALQDQIYKETKEAYGEVAFERWLKPLYVGVLPNPEGYGRITGTCGDTMEIFLRFEDGRVKKCHISNRWMWPEHGLWFFRSRDCPRQEP